MPIYKSRNKDCKYYVEKAMRDLGFKVNNNYSNEMAENECAVVYSQFDNNIESQESYWSTAWCKVVFTVSDNDLIPEKITKVLRKVSIDVESSGAPNCTSFYFTDTDVVPLGQSNRIEMNCRYSYEVDWVDPTNEHQ